MKSDNEVLLPPHGTPPSDYTRLPCNECKTSTPRFVLGKYGGRCGPCFTAYCKAPATKKGET